jgi:hypothetical protein
VTGDEQEDKPGGSHAYTTSPGQDQPDNRLAVWFESFGLTTPNDNYLANTQTYAYMLSAQVFGSLLASFVLGFVASIAVELGREYKVTDVPVEILNLGAWVFVLKLMHVIQYLASSMLFALFTAVIYFRYHQCVVFVDTDKTDSAQDYVQALLIGLAYGLSSLFPYFLPLIFTLTVFFASQRWSKLRTKFIDHIAGKITANITDLTSKNRKTQEAKGHLADGMTNSENEVLKALAAQPPNMKGLYLFTFCQTVLAIGFYAWGINLESFWKSLPSPTWIRVALAVTCCLFAIVAAIKCYGELRTVAKAMPSSKGAQDDALANTLLGVIQSTQLKLAPR